MDKNKVILIVVLAIFIVGMTMSCATAKTVTINTKQNKYVTKKVGKYKIQTFKWKSGTYQEVDIFVYKNGKMLKYNKYSSKFHYKYKGKSGYTKWSHGWVDCTYHKYQMDKGVKVSTVKVRI